MLPRALIQEEGMGRLCRESRETHEVLLARGVQVTLFTRKSMMRGRCAVAPTTLVVGDIDVVERALAQLGREAPPDRSYPEELWPFLHRRVWPSTLEEVRTRVSESHAGAVFVKPRDRLKRFSGRVVSDASSLAPLAGHSGRTPVWCAEPVSFVSEHRVYVIDGAIVGVHGYAGEGVAAPDRDVIARALAAWRDSGRAPRGYGADFGVLTDGRTALVELNDGYGLGNYGLAAERYAELCVARWEELAGR
ncbi:MAG: ATP-grasp domain-containing protein [Sandaracinaceae bacterium]|nr:ATP-grasp domain-containing protein [Sandaracinaceae bacterium]